MQIFIEAIDLNIWKAIEFDPYIPTMVAGNVGSSGLRIIKKGGLN